MTFIDQRTYILLKLIDFISIFHFNHQKTQLIDLNAIVQKRGPFTEFSLFLFDAYARWKGTGEPWSNFTLKVLKIFPRHFWKIFSFLISLYSPLSHGMWILVQHPSFETLAFLEHSEIRNDMQIYLRKFFFGIIFTKYFQSEKFYITWLKLQFDEKNTITM